MSETKRQSAKERPLTSTQKQTSINLLLHAIEDGKGANITARKTINRIENGTIFEFLEKEGITVFTHHHQFALEALRKEWLELIPLKASFKEGLSLLISMLVEAIHKELGFLRFSSSSDGEKQL